MNLLRLRNRTTVPGTVPGTVALFADEEGALKEIDGEGTVTDVGAGGGSQPLKDLGVVTAADIANGIVTLYTRQAGEIVGPVLLRDITLSDGPTVCFRLGGALSSTQVALMDNDTVADSAGLVPLGLVADQPAGAGDNLNYTPTLTVDLLASLTYGLGNYGPADAWQALTVYPALACVIGSDGHLWKTDAGGTSGGSEPDFAGNEGGSVVDGTATWDDGDAVPATGSFHVYAYVQVPA